jgi:DNA-binding transcriptional MerR regulator
MTTTLMTRPDLNDRENSRTQAENVYWVDDPSDGDPPPNADMVLSLTTVSRMFSISRLRLLTFEWLGLTKRRYRIGSARVYGWADCERIALIIKTQRAGLSLKEIMPILHASKGNMEVSVRRRGLARCLRMIDKLEKRRRQIDDAARELQHVCALMAAETSDHARAEARRG